MATHDYVIDNGTGSAVRADINLLLKAILTNNSGTTDPSTVISSDAGSKAFSFWADTNSSPAVLKIRNAADDAWIELFQLDGTLTLEDGSASTPALAFRDDLDTGIFSSAANNINFATGGVERLELSGSSTIFNESGADVNFRVEGDTNVNLLFVDAGEDRIGVNESTPLGKFHIKSTDASVSAVNSSVNELVIENNGSCGMSIFSSTSNQGAIAFGDSDDNDVGKIVYDHSDNSIFFKTAANERLRLDSSGRLLIGTSSARSSGGSVNAHLQLEGTNSQSAEFLITRNSADTFSPVLGLVKTRGTSVGSNTTVADNDVLGTIQFRGADGSDIFSVGASVFARVNGTPSDGTDMPAELVFATTADGASSPTEGMKIESSGKVSVLRNNLNLENASATTSKFFSITNASGSTGWSFGNGITASAHQFVIYDNTAGAARLLINSSGLFGIGETNPSATLDVVGSSAVAAEFHSTGSGGGYIGLFLGASGAVLGYIGRSSELVSVSGTAANLAIRSENEIEFAIGTTQRAKITANGIETERIIQSGANNLIIPILIDDAINANFATDCITFQKNSTGSVGAITCTRSAVTYATSSDYRLKENAVTISDGITRLKTLIPRRFNWIIDDTNTLVDGFFAHEVTAVPEAITGTKDEVATEDIDGKNIKKGDPIYQQIDQAKLVPLLVAAVQELITKVETLEAA